MMPPPITSIFFGTPLSSSAAVESTMRGSSGRKGSFAACEPAAMIADAKRTVLLPSLPSTCRRFLSRKVPTPWTTVTLRIFAIEASPPVSFPTTLSLNARSLARSLRLAKRDAVVGETARGVHDGRGMQERLRGNAADVEAHAAQRRIALDQHRLQPEVRGTKCRRIAARPRTQDDDVAFEIR